MTEERPDLDAVPQWLERLGVASWVCEADHAISRANRTARELLGDPIGRPCHETVHGTDAEDEAFCRLHCPVRKQLEAGEVLDPVRVRVGLRQRWVDLLTLPMGEASPTVPLVHLAVDAESDQSARGYLERVASRNRPRGGRPHVDQCGLTPREREVLRGLAEDKDPQSVARELGLRPTTVRNHVQRILAKLGVHSIQEAVAVLLLNGSRDATSSEG